MTIWGKFRNLFAPKCRSCRTPLNHQQDLTCSAKCAAVHADLATW